MENMKRKYESYGFRVSRSVRVAAGKTRIKVGGATRKYENILYLVIPPRKRTTQYFGGEDGARLSLAPALSTHDTNAFDILRWIKKNR